MENQRPAPFEYSKPVAQLLIFIGITFISFFFLGIVSLLLQQAGIINLFSLQDAASYKDYNVVKVFWIYQSISDIFLFILPVAVIALLVSRNRLQYLQIKTPKSFLMLLLGAITIVAATPLINYMVDLNERIPLPDLLQKLEDSGDSIENALMAYHSIPILCWNVVVMALLAAVGEELFFRAGIQKILIKMSKNTHAGVWIAAIVFSAVHMQFSGFFPRMFLGVFLGYLYVWSGSIWVDIMAHFMFNAAQIVVSYFQGSGATSTATNQLFSQTPGYGYVITSTILVTVLIAIIYRLSRRNNQDTTLDIHV